MGRKLRQRKYPNQEWECVLWKKQPFPDNYVGRDFFRMRTKCEKISYRQALYGSVTISSEICSCINLVWVFSGLSSGDLTANFVLISVSIGIFLCYVFTNVMDFFFSVCKTDWNDIFCSWLSDLKTALFTVAVGIFFAPVIKTLTESVATDSIEACTVGLLFSHLLLYPYGPDTMIVNSTVSHNLGLFAAICLASRLSNLKQVLALMLTAIGSFTLFPAFKTDFVNWFGRKGFVTLFLVILGVSSVGCLQYAPFLTPLLVVVIFVVNLLAPVLFMHYQSYRKNIYGPWDEALINEEIR